jgi:4-azaleucine resistance transporter AzlC
MTDSLAFTWSGLLHGARRTLPLAIGDVVIGIAFGVAARQTGLSWHEAMFMSASVFAGTAQFVALGLWLTPLPIWTIIITTFIVNARHLLMSASLRPWFSRLSASQAYTSLFFMTDETWAMTMQEFAAGKRDAAFMLGCGLMLVAPWLGGTGLGHWMGAAIQDPARWGLDFVTVALMATMLMGLWKGKSQLRAWVTAALIASVTAWWLPGKWYILLGSIAGSVVGVGYDDTPE